MASLYRDQKSPFWYVCYRSPGGKQHIVSTKKTDRTEAEAVKALIEKSHEKAKVGALTETAARSILSNYYQEINGSKLQFTTVKAWFETCLAKVEKQRGHTTHKRYQAVIGSFPATGYIVPDQYDRVCEIVTECFQRETGSVPKIKRK